MRIFYRRPLALAACLCAVCAVLIWQWSGGAKLILGIFALSLLLLLLTGCLLRKRFGYAALVSVLSLVGVCLSVLSSYLFFNVRYESYRAMDGEVCEAEGIVLERLQATSFSTQLRVRLTEIDGEACRAGAVVECTYASALQVGDCFCMTATPRDFEKDELFDEETYRLSDGCLTVLVCADAEQCRVLDEKSNSPLVWASRINTALSSLLQSTVGGEAGGVTAALLLGNRSWLSGDHTLDFRRAGVSHLLALSGLHVSILIGFAEFLLRRLFLPPKARAVLVPSVAVGYVVLTGMSVSTWRAALMLCVLYLGLLLRENYDSFTALCVVLVLILIVTPYAVLDLSLWMSFLAAGSIIVFSPAVQRLFAAWEKKRPPRLIFSIGKAVVGALAVGVAANLALLLLSASVFGEISLMSVPVTLLLSLPVTALIICGAVTLCFPSLPILPWFCSFLGTLILKVCAWASELEHILLPVGDLHTKSILLLLTVLLILFAVIRLKRKRWLAVLPILCAAVISSLWMTYLPRDAEWEAVAIPSGVGEVRLYTKHGSAVLINDTRGSASSAYEIKAAATDARCTEIDDLVFCRYYNQATYFIARLSSQIRVRTLHLPVPSDERETVIAARLAEEAALHGIEVAYDAEAYLITYDQSAP